MVVVFAANIVSNLVATLYPGYKSYKMIRSGDARGYVRKIIIGIDVSSGLTSSLGS